jgi:hypothetical protein
MPCEDPFVIALPILSDEALDAIHNVLLDTVTPFENQYFGQLHRYHHGLEEEGRRHQPSPFDRYDEDDKPF